MNAAHWHLLLNHIPILGSVFGFLLLAYALLRRRSPVVRTGLIKASLGTFVIVGLIAIPVYVSGDGAEDIVEDQPTITDEVIEPHEEVAVYALLAAIILGGLSLGGLAAYRGRRVPSWFTVLVFLLGFATSVVMGYTAYLGGQINHPEIRADRAAGTVGADISIGHIEYRGNDHGE